MYFTPISVVWGGVGVKISSNRCVCVCAQDTSLCILGSELVLVPHTLPTGTLGESRL